MREVKWSTCSEEYVAGNRDASGLRPRRFGCRVLTTMLRPLVCYHFGRDLIPDVLLPNSSGLSLLPKYNDTVFGALSFGFFWPIPRFGFWVHRYIWYKGDQLTSERYEEVVFSFIYLGSNRDVMSRAKNHRLMESNTGRRSILSGRHFIKPSKSHSTS